MIRSFILLLILGMVACQSADTTTANPPADGFNLEASDQKAIALADEVMESMGGRKAWDEARYFAWTFFGFRNLLWDKQTGDVRVEVPRDSLTILVNIKDGSGKVKKAATEYTHPDSLAKFLGNGKNIWINDAYWLVMPFKLKDSGVTLKYDAAGTTQDGKAADILQLTFENVGNTPNNKYLVYVDKESKLVTQWDFFANATDPEPRFSTPWADYKSYGKLRLSGNRGQRSLTNIAVPETLPSDYFSSLEAIDWTAIAQ
ncbi:MAG: hypothetical protein AAFO94_05465 [Bacteroidota bacterium]